MQHLRQSRVHLASKCKFVFLSSRFFFFFFILKKNDVVRGEVECGGFEVYIWKESEWVCIQESRSTHSGKLCEGVYSFVTEKWWLWALILYGEGRKK